MIYSCLEEKLLATQTNIKRFIFCQCPSTVSFMTSTYPYNAMYLCSTSIYYVYCFHVVDCYTNNLYKEDYDYLVTKSIKQMQKSNKVWVAINFSCVHLRILCQLKFCLPNRNELRQTHKKAKSLNPK